MILSIRGRVFHIYYLRKMPNFNQEIKSKFLNSTQSRLKSIKYGKLRVGPELVRIGISKTCNFNCMSCWYYSPLLKKQKSQRWKAVKIDKDLVFNLIDELAQMQCVRVLFSGAGEPFTHPNMMDFIKRVVTKKMLVDIQTNLSLVEDPYQLIDYLGPGAGLISVHLSAVNPDTYAKMHPNQKRKTFYEVLEKIKILRNKNIPIRLVYIVNKLNYKEINDVFKLNKILGTKLHLEIMDYSPGEGIDEISLNKIESRELLQILLKLKKYKEYIRKSNLLDFINQLIHSTLGLETLKRCCVGYFFSAINEFGCVNYCCNVDKEFLMGDLNKKSFKDIWFSQKYKELRANLLQGKFLDICQDCIRKRSYNFKIRIYIEPKVRDLKLERKLIRTVNEN